MDRERFEDLIIDYIEGNLNRQEENEFLSALTEYEEYREIYDQYVSIRNIMETEEDISPSEEILKNISEYAKESVKKENPSLFKKWFTLPILAPLLGTAIVAIFWFSAGEEYLKNKNIIKTSEVSQDKEVRKNFQARSSEHKQAGEPSVAEEQIIDLKINKFESEETDELDAVVSAPASSGIENAVEPDVYRDVKPDLQTETQKTFADNKRTDSMMRSTQIPESEVPSGMAEEPGKGDLRTEMEAASESNTAFEEAVDDMIEKRTLKKESVGAKITVTKSKDTVGSADKDGGNVEFFRQKVNDVLLQQYQGDCLNSIKLSNEVLNSKPKPPKAVQTTLYLSQAECYEELNQIDDAIKAYEKVQVIDPASTSFFSGKIRQLNLKKVK